MFNYTHAWLGLDILSEGLFGMYNIDRVVDSIAVKTTVRGLYLCLLQNTLRRRVNF